MGEWNRMQDDSSDTKIDRDRDPQETSGSTNDDGIDPEVANENDIHGGLHLAVNIATTI